MSQRTSVFSRLVADAASDRALTVSPGMDLGSVVERMSAEKATSAIVVDGDDHPIGILTEQDITRRITFKVPSDEKIENVMSWPVVTVRTDEYFYYAIARMRRRGLRHMPVVDQDGKTVGILRAAKSVADASSRLMDDIDKLTREDSIQGLSEIKAAQVEIADHLFNDAIPGPEIQGLLTRVNNDIYRRVVNLNVKSMYEEGMGKPPVEFTVIVMGSGGRGENYLYPDQDNGFILADYPDKDHATIDAWFIELAERVTRDLDTVGLPYCKGYVMATNPLWRKTISQWKQQIEIWNRRRNTTTLRLCDIFFDFRGSWGSQALAVELYDHVMNVIGGNRSFLRAMYEDDREHGTALGWFGRFIVEKDEKDYIGQMNLKHTGTLPLVESMRMLALREKIPVLPTLGRMEALHDNGVLDANEHDYLSGAFRHISHLLLRQQISDFKNGKRVSNYVHRDSLTEREKDILTDSFKAIDALRKRMRSEMTGEVF